jgi:hypothetical protein
VDHLLIINVDCTAAPPATLRTVWATTPDVRAGPRRTDVEKIADEPALLRRLAELAPRLVPPAAAVREGSATMVPDPVLARAAGGGRRAA